MSEPSTMTVIIDDDLEVPLINRAGDTLIQCMKVTLLKNCNKLGKVYKVQCNQLCKYFIIGRGVTGIFVVETSIADRLVEKRADNC